MNESGDHQNPQAVSSVFFGAQAAVLHVQEVSSAVSMYVSWYQVKNKINFVPKYSRELLTLFTVVILPFR